MIKLTMKKPSRPTMELSKGRGIAPAVGIVVSGPVSVGDATSSDEVKSA
jgi:hypothetical protein